MTFPRGCWRSTIRRGGSWLSQFNERAIATPQPTSAHHGRLLHRDLDQGVLWLDDIASRPQEIGPAADLADLVDDWLYPFLLLDHVSRSFVAALEPYTAVRMERDYADHRRRVFAGVDRSIPPRLGQARLFASSFQPHSIPTSLLFNSYYSGAIIVQPCFPRGTEERPFKRPSTDAGRPDRSYYYGDKLLRFGDDGLQMHATQGRMPIEDWGLVDAMHIADRYHNGIIPRKGSASARIQPSILLAPQAVQSRADRLQVPFETAGIDRARSWTCEA
ncbi:uncharacterized protein PG998_002986 [Apiospora kogelbergensis]|uniref:uncharacterized protein n=1 Tax=Apiospora kogelbergensis TaxID=1337665 RepID=UPI00312CE7A7